MRKGILMRYRLLLLFVLVLLLTIGFAACGEEQITVAPTLTVKPMAFDYEVVTVPNLVGEEKFHEFLFSRDGIDAILGEERFRPYRESLGAALSRYDEAYFQEKTLLIVHVTADTANSEHAVTSLNTLNSSLGYRLEVNVESKTYGVPDPDPISVFYLIAVDAIPEKKLFDDVYYHHTVKDY